MGTCCQSVAEKSSFKMYRKSSSRFFFSLYNRVNQYLQNYQFLDSRFLLIFESLLLFVFISFRHILHIAFISGLLFLSFMHLYWNFILHLKFYGACYVFCLILYFVSVINVPLFQVYIMLMPLFQAYIYMPLFQAEF